MYSTLAYVSKATQNNIQEHTLCMNTHVYMYFVAILRAGCLVIVLRDDMESKLNNSCMHLQ